MNQYIIKYFNNTSLKYWQNRQYKQMNGKLFQLRNKLNDLDGFRRYIQKNELSRQQCQHILRHACELNRDKLIKILQIIKQYHKISLSEVKFKQNSILAELCKVGTLQQLQVVLKLQSIRNLDTDKRKQLLSSVLQNTQRRKDRNQVLQIIKLFLSIQPKFAAQQSSKFLAQALNKQQFQVAELLIQSGINVDYESAQKENIMHVLTKNYNKKFENYILNIRSLLINRGVDQRKININGKRPLQFCPQLQKKIGEEMKSQAVNKRNKIQQNTKQKGKSQQGSYMGRFQNIEYRQKAQSSALRIDTTEDLYKTADNCLQKRTKQKQKQFVQRQKLVQKSRQKKQKNKKVLTPQQLKYFLNEEIMLFIQQIQRENEQQKAFLHQLIQKITTKIKQTVGAFVKIFGSFATQLSLYQSDIDMVIIPTQQNQSQSSFKLLQTISNLLETMSEQVQTVKFIKTASVPIIKIQCSKKYRSKKIDITYKDQNHNGLDSVELIQNYLAIYPQLRPLVFVLKKFIYCTNIYDPYSGGLSSYGLILMIVAYLQNQNRQRKARGGNEFNKLPSIAELLIGFLYYYGFKCNYISKKICILNPQKAKQQMQATYIDKYKEHPIYVDAMDIQLMMYPNDWQPRAKLMIEDPLNPNNNIGRATHKIRQIKTAFQMAYVCIHTIKNCKSKKSCQSYKRIMSLNSKQINYKRPCCIIKRMLNSTKSFMVI